MARTTFAQHGLVRLGYEVQGEGRAPVLVLHGLLASRASLYPLMDGLEDKATVIAMDLRGHGGSSAIHGVDLHIDDLVADALAVLDAAEVTQPAIIIGIELGAVIAERMHQQHPTRVAGSILVNYPSAALLNPDTLTDIAARAYREQAEQALNMWLDLSWGEGWQGTAPRNRVAAARRSAQAMHPVLTALAAAHLSPVESLNLPGGDPFAAENAIEVVIQKLDALATTG